jgi:hypothetical protein
MNDGAGPAVLAARWLAAQYLRRLADEIEAGEDHQPLSPAEARANAAEAQSRFGVRDDNAMIMMASDMRARAVATMSPLTGGRDFASKYHQGPWRPGPWN